MASDPLTSGSEGKEDRLRLCSSTLMGTWRRSSASAWPRSRPSGRKRLTIAGIRIRWVEQDCESGIRHRTPYAGIGLDFLDDHRRAYSFFSSIDLHYRTYYALFGFDMHYSWTNCYLGLQADCLPVFDQYLKIGGLNGTAYKMNERVGVAVRLPIGCKLSKYVWLELEPYYRLLPIGSSHALEAPKRTLNQWGGFLTFRFFVY